jgi:hypothetical protein
MEGDAKPKPPSLRARLTNLAYKPMQFRVILTAAILGGWYAGLAMPMTAEIDQTTGRVAREQKRLELAKQIERLRGEVARFKDRIPASSEPNEWIQYMLAGFRRFQVRVVTLNTDGFRDIGPYRAVVIRTDVTGPYQELEEFLRWLESNPRLLRVDSLKLARESGVAGAGNAVKATLIVLGVTS